MSANSLLTFGLMRLPTLPDGSVNFDECCSLFDTFIDHGFNRFDTAVIYHNGQSEEAVQRCLAKRYSRDKFRIAHKLSSWKVPQEVKAIDFFNKQLQDCGVDFFDHYLLHSVEEKTLPDAENRKFIDFILEQKSKGLIKEAGFSFHGTPELLEEMFNKYPEFDFVQLQINYLDWDAPNVQSGKCHEIAVKNNKRILVMEPVKGGHLANLHHQAAQILKTFNPNASCASWAIRFAASLPNVESVLSGMSNMDQLQDNMSLMENFQPLSDKELEKIGEVRAFMKSIPLVECTKCNYCTNECPLELPIPSYIANLNQIQLYSDSPIVKKSYFHNIAKHHPNECVSCHCCTSVCPQHLDIPGHLERLAKLTKDWQE